MIARPKTRRVNRERNARSSQGPRLPRGAKQLVIPMTRAEYEDLWPHPDRLRAFVADVADVADVAAQFPELFPPGFERGYWSIKLDWVGQAFLPVRTPSGKAACGQTGMSAPPAFSILTDHYAWHGYGRGSEKLPGSRLRKLVLTDGSASWLRPRFVLSYMTGTVDELAYPLLLAAHGVPAWLLTLGFGHSDLFWHRLLERLGRNSLVGTTVRHAVDRPMNRLRRLRRLRLALELSPLRSPQRPAARP